MAGASLSRMFRGMIVSEYLVFEVTFHFIGHLVGEVVPAVEHGEQNSFDLQLRIEGLFNQADRFEKLAQPFHGIVFALERDDDGVGRRQGVDGQKAQRGRAVDEDIVVVGLHLFDQAIQLSFPILLLNQFHFCTDQVGIGNDHIQIGEGVFWIISFSPEPRSRAW